MRELDSEVLHLLPLGVGDAFTTRYYHTSFLLLAGGAVVLVDVPAPFGKMLREATEKAGLRVSTEDITDVVLTHLHRDHCNGLEEFAYRRMLAGEGVPLPRLHLLDELTELLWYTRLEPSLGPGFPPAESFEERMSEFFLLNPLDRGQGFATELAELVFETRITRHSKPCFGFRADYRGARLAYSCDTEWDPEHLDWLAEDADLIVHEVGEEGPHTPLEKLAGLPPGLRRRMRLVHLPDALADRDLPMPPLRQGEILSIQKRGGEG